VVHLGLLRGAAGFAKIVAIKQLHPQLAKDPDFVAMFKYEAHLASRIEHPSVAATLDVVSEDGELLVVMEYIHGETLSRLIRSKPIPTPATTVGPPSDRQPPSSRGPREPVPVDIACSIMGRVLEGLHAAHEACDETGKPLGLVHRDVSPQNIMVGVNGGAKVLDFGVAKAAGAAQTTKEGTIKGKIAYMSPEQIYGDKLDRRADIYAAGVVLWELLTGRRLFAGDANEPAIAKALEAVIDPPGLLVPTLPAELDDVAMRALSRSREDRFDTALEMAHALTSAAKTASAAAVGAWVEKRAAKPLAERTELIALVEAQASDPTTDSDATTLVTTGPSWASRLVVATAVAAVLLAGAAMILTAGSGETTTTPSAAADVNPAPLTTTTSMATVTTATTATTAQAIASETTSTAATTAAPAATASASTQKQTEPPRPPRPSSGDCKPPFTVDDKGHKRYKPHCFR